jgi:3-methylcrotonyl-CoA carboxylase alpha subunit
MFSSFDFVDSK